MTKSILPTKIKHSNISHTTTSLARRALLLISFLLLGLGNVWGQEVELGSGSQVSLTYNQIPDVFGTSEIVLRAYVTSTSSSANIFISRNDGSWMSIIGDDYTVRFDQDSEYYKSDKGCFEFNLNKAQSAKLRETGLISNGESGTTLINITYEIPTPDTFEDPDKSPKSTGIDFTRYLTSETLLPLDIAKATALLEEEAVLRYARFYVLHNGEPLDLSKNDGLLTIKEVTPEKQSPNKGIYGYYLYNYGNELDLSGIKVTLNAGAGKFPEYQVICVLSTSEARKVDDSNGNVVTEEPNWDVVFTYAFRNQVQKQEHSGTIAWDAVAMTASVPADDMAENWGTTWANLAQGQKIQWYVTSEENVKQPMVFGAERQEGKWTINLSEPFSINDNVATLTRQTIYNAASFKSMWNIWGNPAIYAPADKGYADVKDYKIVCEIADDPEATEPNVVYTLSMSRTSFAGQEKTTIVKTTQQVKVDAGTTSANIPLNLPEGTKYVRFYVVDQNGTNVNEPWINEGTAIYGKEITGKYIYSEQGLALSSITIGSNSATLNDYQVIMVTSKETADLSQYEPDYDAQTTFWFKYPATLWETSGNVDWSLQSMQIAAPDIEGKKDEGYLSENRQHYTLQWTVEDKDGNPQSLCIGDSRIDDCWSVSILANPFTLGDDGKVLTVSDDTNLNTITWNNWTAPLFFAPKNKTKNQLAGTKFVCRLYEDDEAGDDENMLAMIYTIDMVRPELGLLKDEGLYKEEIIGEDDIDHTQTVFPFSLDHATDAFRTAFGKATYVRVYLAKNDGTALHPREGEEQLAVTGGTPFTTNPEYGYYFYNENGVDLSDVMATLTLPDGMFTYYNVVVAMSKDEADVNSGNVYEPDYDYVYTFKFIETSTFPGMPAENLITHEKEVQIKVENIEKPVLIPLHEETTVNEFLNELGETGSFSDMASKYYHIRWFVAKKNDDGSYEKLAASENMLDVVSTDWSGAITGTRSDLSHVKRRNQGIYWNKDCLYEYYNNYSTDIIKVSFAKPADGNWSDYQVIVWMTNDGNEAIKDDETNTLSHEPDIKIQYIYSFVVEEESALAPSFVHYQGEAYRYLKEKGEDVAAQQRDYITLDGDPWLPEYTWNIDTETYEPILGNIRQSVHTWEYDIYVKPDEERKLILPFQWYDDSDHDGNADEPRGYIRWYDWNTDTKVVDNNFTFTKVGNKLDENDRGLFALCLTIREHPTHERVGVTFTPNAAFTNPIDIACDVSKYSDGIMTIGQYENVKYYLLHEPTLSNRYIFHIHPASEIADSLVTARQRLEEAIWQSTIDTNILYDAMSTLKEDKGKVVVSIKDGDTEFALRFDHHNLHNYMLRDGDGYAPAEEVQWYAYIENNGSISPQFVSGIADDTDRIYTFKYSTFAGMGNGPIHVVGYAGKDGFSIENSTDVYAPVVHYELQFIEAPPIPLTNILSDLTDDKIKYKERMESYMSLHYDVKGVVDFDGNPETNEDIKKNPYEALYYYSTPNWDTKPTTSADNMSYVPLPWDYNQYGFCYPQLTSTIKNGYGGVYTSPEHGDYIILKTMNVDPYSKNKDGEAPYQYQWWNESALYDYTYNATKNTASPQYGSFLYTDASDESRSIATIPFTAELCSGSSFYFTAIMANMTDYADPGIGDGKNKGRKISPQLLIRIVGIKDDGTRERIVAFHTGAFTQNVADLGKWYQVYGTSMVSRDFDTSITRFEAEVINYANGTLGADFALDQIVIYTSTSKVLLTQTGDASCKPNEDEVEPDKVKAYMEADGLQGAFGISNELQPIYWRICDEDNGEVITGPGMYPRYDKEGNLTPDDGTFTYGVTWVKSNFSDSDLGLITEEHPYGWYYDSTTEKYFFQIADKSFDALEEGKHYYVSVFDPTAGFESINDDHFWGGLYFGAKNRCSIYSEFFVPRRQYMTYTYGKNGTEGGELTIECGGTGATVKDVQMILKVPDDNEPTGYKNYTDFLYDYVFVSLKTLKSDEILYETYKYSDLLDALFDYRKNFQTGTTLNDDYKLNQAETYYYDVLEYAISVGLLELACSTTFEHTFTDAGKHVVTCVPVKKYLDEAQTIEICAPFEVTFRLKNSGGPELDLGFSDVTYPTEPTKYLRVVRVGQEQLKNMQEGSFLLHIPVHSFKINTDADVYDGTLAIIGNLELLAKGNGENQTNDADWNTGVDVATFEEPREISKERMYISINFHDSEITKPTQTFKEGFTYRMFFRVQELDNESACDAGVEFLMKVVPEYVTWNDKGTEVTPNSNQNTNWNNDANWSRSKKEELYKTSGYQNNGTEVGDNGVTSTPATFVPMKFTYVTIPSDNVAPNLIELETGTIVSTDYGIYTNIGEGATSNIQYDMMVRMEEECQDHSIDGDVYDCEKFYGNWAKEIYFKPRAELVNQHYLTYEKVWVEKELTANTWTLMSTPLQNTYAGDMYVPISGRQETEAFTGISFGEGYSRTLYPIYQKSWKQEGSKVYTMTNDVRANDYNAELKGSVTSTLSLWSHTYNDVQEPYSQWKGFAIRAHKKEQKDKALLRLPKEDIKYDYYKWDGTVPEENNVMQTVEKPITGKLFTDKDAPVEKVTYGVEYGTQGRTAGDGNVEIPIDEVQDNNDYLLVGNPYLCSIDMAKFLKANETILENAYWTYEHNTIESPYTKGTIKPLQAFFVKVKDGVTNGDTNIMFTPEMMIDGNTNPITPSAVSAMTMTASNERGRSTATLSVGEETKSVETLFDSNLEDVPMVYTVADGQAVSIQQVTDLDKPIAFGVTCAASNELVEVTFTDVAQLTDGDVYVVDAVTGEQTVVGEGSTLSLQPNDYGRYYLLAGTTDITDKVDMQKGIMVSVRGREVTVTSGEELTLVHALSLTGATVYQDAARSTTASFSLPSGVYVIQAENAVGEQQTVKVIVK